MKPYLILTSIAVAMGLSACTIPENSAITYHATGASPPAVYYANSVRGFASPVYASPFEHEAKKSAAFWGSFR